MPYILEVQNLEKFPEPEYSKLPGTFKHIGYMNIVFKSKTKAFEYYNKYNKHMRSINAHNTNCSDWDPNTYLRYIVREYYHDYLSIDPFNKNDMPIIENNSGSRSVTYGPHDEKQDSDNEESDEEIEDDSTEDDEN